MTKHGRPQPGKDVALSDYELQTIEASAERAITNTTSLGSVISCLEKIGATVVFHDSGETEPQPKRGRPANSGNMPAIVEALKSDEHPDDIAARLDVTADYVRRIAARLAAKQRPTKSKATD